MAPTVFGLVSGKRKLMNDIRKLSSYDIAGKGLPSKVENIVYVAHIAPLLLAEQYIKNKYCKDIGISISLRSSYRSLEWERSKGRSGYSEHTYNFLGASDITCKDFEKNKEILLEALIAVTRYTRLAVYNGFIHGDYKNAQDDACVYNDKWVRQQKIQR